MKIIKTLTSIALCAAVALSSSAVFSAAAKKPSVKVSNKATAIKIKWTKTAGAKKYTLVCKKGSGKYKKLYTGSNTSFTFKKPSAGKKYTFKVKAAGRYSKAESITFLRKLTKITAEEDLDMQGIVVKWAKVTGAKKYVLYRSVKSRNSYKKIASLSSKVRTYHDKGLKSIESYKYYVVAVNGKSKSAKSSVASDVYGYYNTKTNAPLALTIAKGKEYRDIYEKLDKYFATGLVSWKSLNTSIVKVDSFGIFKGVKKGTATVLATIKQGTYKNNKDKVIKINVTVK